VRQTEVAKLQAYLQHWRSANPYRWQQGAQVVANDLLQDVAFTRHQDRWAPGISGGRDHRPGRSECAALPRQH
jgi:hypothetical protein